MPGSIQNSPTFVDPSLAPAQGGLPRHANPRQRIDPLSAERYRVVFTGDASLKQKLELARDLLRHSHPSGDFAPIVSRALDLLLQELLQRRFGARRQGTPHRSARTPANAAPATAESATAKSATAESATAESATMTPPLEIRQSSALPIAGRSPPPTVAAPSAATPLASAPPAPAPLAAPASRITRAARRAVLERDGLGCSWVDATGKRCGSTAWLELDHHHPRGKNGGSEPNNLRLLCRAHNRFAAERAYGREHVQRSIQARQRSTKRRCQNEPPPSSSPTPA
jgi:hypothetical protein